MNAPEAGATVRAVGVLTPHPGARSCPALSKSEYRALHADVAEHGLRVPLEVTADGVVLDGHARLQIAKQLGIEEVPVLLVGPAEPVEHMLRAALNRRQLDPSQRAALALKLLPYNRLREQARQRQQAALEPSEPVRAGCPHRLICKARVTWSQRCPRQLRLGARVTSSPSWRGRVREPCRT